MKLEKFGANRTKDGIRYMKEIERRVEGAKLFPTLQVEAKLENRPSSPKQSFGM